jgi:diguanylate cyclase (GGDEF)-like protein
MGSLTVQPASADLTPAPGLQGASAGRVLIAEDDAFYRHALRRLLAAKGYEVESVTDGGEALRKASAANPARLLILDWMMPCLHGPEICRKVRERASERYQYILLLTARNTPADVVEGLEAGADDYLVKPFNAHELLARLRVGERMLRLHDGLLAAQESLRFQATHDSLTGLWNRRALFELVRTELERSARKQAPVSLLLIDIDHFKQVNDRCGHQMGDSVLQEVARRLASGVRPYDHIGRYGGEEFVVCAAELKSQAARQLGDRLREAVSTSPIHSSEQEVAITISVGVATAEHPANCTTEKLLQSADAAMYQAKENGRNRVETALR